MASASAQVQLASEFEPFLHPNVFCDYAEDSACVARARELVASASNQGEAVKSICTFVVDKNMRFRICLEQPKRKNTDVLYALAGVKEGLEQEIPLWMYGFLY